MQGCNNSEILMNRRIYKLMNNTKSDNNFFLVHYLKENCFGMTSLHLSAKSELTEDKNTQETISIPTFSPSIYG